jgi:hypothetical protein
MGHSFLCARQNTGLLWHTAVRPSIHASYDNISHLFPLLLIGHVVTYIVLIKGGASERCEMGCGGGGWGRIMAQLFILSYSDAVSFRDLRGHMFFCLFRRQVGPIFIPRVSDGLPRPAIVAFYDKRIYKKLRLKELSLSDPLYHGKKQHRNMTK